MKNIKMRTLYLYDGAITLGFHKEKAKVYKGTRTQLPLFSHLTDKFHVKPMLNFIMEHFCSKSSGK